VEVEVKGLMSIMGREDMRVRKQSDKTDEVLSLVKDSYIYEYF
jgi:hypothetical protein